jgi:RNA polymerase sigma factor (sigma-70 family)
VIARLRGGDETARREAFGDLAAGYWKPVYKHLRITWKLGNEDAQDLTQSFFSEAYQKAWLERYDPARARFRTFIRVCADRLVMNWQQSASRMKRGGSAETVPLDFAEAERELAANHDGLADADAFFQREFVRALLDRALTSVHEEYLGSGRETHVRLFEQYDVAGSGDVTYAALAEQYGLTTAQVTNYLAQIRRSFRQHALTALEGLTGTREEFRREARDLFGLDVE